jgi:hypothetical protein
MGGNIAVSPSLQGSLRAFLVDNIGSAPSSFKARLLTIGVPPHDSLWRDPVLMLHRLPQAKSSSGEAAPALISSNQPR